jgi:EmrB/QacA subfamily drug resistance transporter
MSLLAQTATGAANKQRWTALALLCTAQFLVIMDTSIIGVALPAIKEALGYSHAGLQWIFNAYVILFGGLLLLGGRLADLYGPRRVFLWGFAVLALASLFAGFAWSPGSLNVGRAAQGLGSALIAPASMTLLMMTFTDPKELNKAFGFWGASAAAGGSAGVFLGGVITEWISWQWVFFINIPIALVVLFLGRSYLIPGFRNKVKMDYLGAALVTASLILLVYAIVSFDGSSAGQSLIPAAAAIILFAVFISLQKRRAHPLLPLSIFRTPNFSVGNIVIGLLGAAWIPLWFFFNLYLQQTLNYSAFNSGLALLPMTITIMIVMVGITGKLIQRFGYKEILVAGLLLLTISLLLFALVPPNGSYIVNVLPASIIGALGMSLAHIPSNLAALSAVKPQETGLASGILNMSYQIGSALGLAVVMVIAGMITKSQAEEGVAQAFALNAGFKAAFISAAVISAVAALLTKARIRIMK